MRPSRSDLLILLRLAVRELLLELERLLELELREEEVRLLFPPLIIKPFLLTFSSILLIHRVFLTLPSSSVPHALNEIL
jgi:hypothetical protein